MKYIHIYYISFLFLSVFSFSQERILIEGSVVDESNFEIPYAAVGIIKKNLGTTSTSEGTFSFIVTTDELEDDLEISSIGFETFKINVRDFINSINKKITLEEKTTQLNEAVVYSPLFYIKNAFKKLKENTINKNHQLDILYRRWDVEENICRFFIEHFINVIDRGPSSSSIKFNVKESRNSADYRYVKNMAKVHPMQSTVWMNPIRRGTNLNSFDWKKTENTFYDGEDVMVYEGKGNSESLKLYIGFDTGKIYRAERSWVPTVGKSQNGIWLYKKNSEGKLYLSYHQRDWKGARKLPNNVINILKSNGKSVPDFVPVEFRHEFYVIGLEENKSKFSKFQQSLETKDMALYKIPFNEFFWKNISLPPETSYFKKNIKELESLYGVPIETQFKYSN
tara:strand:+ start:170 stop:1354 length:1185 start_codon:yes stop_codon:yes gene_type:complete